MRRGRDRQAERLRAAARIPLLWLSCCPFSRGRAAIGGLEYGVAPRQMCTLKERAMSKGLDRKREAKKKPQKSLQEKRAAKKEKKQSRGFQPL